MNRWDDRAWPDFYELLLPGVRQVKVSRAAALLLVQRWLIPAHRPNPVTA